MTACLPDGRQVRVVRCLRGRVERTYVNPVIAVLLGVLMVGERFSVLQLVGGGIVLFAVVLVIATERSRNRRGRVAPSLP